MSTQGTRDRSKHDLGHPRGDPRHLHAGRLRVPRGRADANEERRPHRGEERPDPGDRLDRLLPRRLRDGVRRRRHSFVGGSGFVPTVDELLSIGQAPFSWFSEIPGAAGYLFEVAFAAVSLAIVWGAMAERTKLWVYFAFGALLHAHLLARLALDLEPGGLAVRTGMQDFAGSTVVHYQGALAGLAGALLLGPRLGKFGPDGKPNAIPGHNMAYTTLGVIILWFGWFGFNPGSTLTSVRQRGRPSSVVASGSSRTSR